jgi:hypothetical protein
MNTIHPGFQTWTYMKSQFLDEYRSPVRQGTHALGNMPATTGTYFPVAIASVQFANNDAASWTANRDAACVLTAVANALLWHALPEGTNDSVG